MTLFEIDKKVRKILFKVLDHSATKKDMEELAHLNAERSRQMRGRR